MFDTLTERRARPQANLVIIGRDDVATHNLKVTLDDPQLVVHDAATRGTRPRRCSHASASTAWRLTARTASRRWPHLADMPGTPTRPIAVFAPKGLSRRRGTRAAASAPVGRPCAIAQSPERLFDDVALLLHRPFETLPAPRRARRSNGSIAANAMLAGRKVLIVDDDIRNIFAMTTRARRLPDAVISAEDGKEGIEKLQQTPGIDIVLMDIMMPDMDGYDTMRAIRRIPAFRSLPIVAVTAKAMKGDREKCIEAGAWDYLPKPVDSEQLLSVFRTWLHR